MINLRVIAVRLAFIALAFPNFSAQQSEAAPSRAQQPPSPSQPGRQYSGMYSFLKDGEFVQLTVEDDSKVSGSISRYAEDGSDKDGGDKSGFVDQFFRTGALDGNKLSFATVPLRGIWFDFNGTVDRGEGKNPGDEAYYVLNGTLTESATDAQKKVTTHSQAASFKMFPRDAPRN